MTMSSKLILNSMVATALIRLTQKYELSINEYSLSGFPPTNLYLHLILIRIHIRGSCSEIGTTQHNAWNFRVCLLTYLMNAKTTKHGFIFNNGIE